MVSGVDQLKIFTQLIIFEKVKRSYSKIILLITQYSDKQQYKNILKENFLFYSEFINNDDRFGINSKILNQNMFVVFVY